jgi:hypothetical protein
VVVSRLYRLEDIAPNKPPLHDALVFREGVDFREVLVDSGWKSFDYKEAEKVILKLGYY